MIAWHRFVEALQLKRLHNLDDRRAEAEQPTTGRIRRHKSDDETLEITVPTSNFGIQPEEIVSSFYQAILDRNPDEPGLLHHARRIRNGTPLTEVARDFVNSVESKLHQVVSLRHLDALPPNVIDLDLSPQKSSSSGST